MRSILAKLAVLPLFALLLQSADAAANSTGPAAAGLALPTPSLKAAAHTVPGATKSNTTAGTTGASTANNASAASPGSTLSPEAIESLEVIALSHGGRRLIASAPKPSTNSGAPPSPTTANTTINSTVTNTASAMGNATAAANPYNPKLRLGTNPGAIIKLRNPGRRRLFAPPAQRPAHLA